MKLPFEPFGYRFELTSPASPVDVKASIRLMKREWLDAAEGPRGWVVGPFVCLWSAAFSQYGPMLIGHISRSQGGTRITGRAGSDLNGTLLFATLLPVMVLYAFDVATSANTGFTDLLIPAGLVMGTVLIFWIAHSDRHDADPLVSFLTDAVAAVRHS